MTTLATRDHLLAVPFFTHGLRIAQLVVAIIELGLTAYGVTFWAFDGDSLMLFTALSTIILTVYIGVSTFVLPIAYNYWAILGLDAFGVIFWLISFALLASEVSDYSVGSASCDYIYGYCYKKRDLALATRATTNVKTYHDSMAAASGLGGLEFVLFVATLVITALWLHRHRQAGGHCIPNAGTTGGITGEPKGVELQQPPEGYNNGVHNGANNGAVYTEPGSQQEQV